jgi:hypothetical protein
MHVPRCAWLLHPRPDNEIWPLWTVSGHYVLEYPYDMIWPL